MKATKLIMALGVLVAATLSVQAQDRIPAAYKWLNNKEVAFSYDGTYTDGTCFKLKVGKVKARHFSCSVVSGAMFEGNQEVQVWFSDDANCLPLAVLVPLRIGAVRGWLKSWDNLKYPFSSLVK